MSRRFFPNLGPKMVCPVSEMVACSPSEVHTVVPGAATKQIGGFYKLIEALNSTGPVKRLQCGQVAKQLSAGDAILEQLRQLNVQRLEWIWHNFNKNTE